MRLISIEQPTGCSGNGLAITNLRNFTNLRNIHTLDVVSSHRHSHDGPALFARKANNADAQSQIHGVDEETEFSKSIFAAFKV
jgi:hypothetical protein